MSEKIVCDPTLDKTLKARKKERADEPLHAEKAKGERPVEKDKINKYGFQHVDKALAQHLGVEFGKDKADVPVTIEPIEGGIIVRLKA